MTCKTIERIRVEVLKEDKILTEEINHARYLSIHAIGT